MAGKWYIDERKRFGRFGKHRWTIRFVADNGERIIPTEPYNSQRAASAAIGILQNEAATAPVEPA